MIKKESTFMEDGPPCHTARHSRLDVLVQYGAHPYQHPVIVLCSRKVLPIFSSGRMIKKESTFMEDGPPCHTARHSRLDVLVQYGAHPYQHPVIVLCSRKVLPIFSSGKMIKKESISMEDGPPCHTARHSRLDVLVQYGVHPYQHPATVCM